MKIFVLALVLLTVSPALSVPRLKSVGRLAQGYNIFTGFPLSTSGTDPGFSPGDIFQLTFAKAQTSADGNWAVPDGVSMQNTYDCSVSGSATVVKNSFDMSNLLKVGVNAKFSGFGAAFGASVGYSSIKNETKQEDKVFTFVIGKCSVYEASVHSVTHPAFSTDFETWLGFLPDEYNATNAHWYYKFIDQFGTHFLDQMSVGAEYWFQFTSTQQAINSLTAKGVNVGTAASYAGAFKLGVSVNVSHQHKQEAAEFSNSTSEKFFSVGTPPTSSDWHSWVSSILTSPLLGEISMKLTAVSDLFNFPYTSNSTNMAKQPHMEAALADYCSKWLMPNGLIDDCTAPKYHPGIPVAPSVPKKTKLIAPGTLCGWAHPRKAPGQEQILCGDASPCQMCPSGWRKVEFKHAIKGPHAYRVCTCLAEKEFYVGDHVPSGIIRFSFEPRHGCPKGWSQGTGDHLGSGPSICYSTSHTHIKGASDVACGLRAGSTRHSCGKCSSPDRCCPSGFKEYKWDQKIVFTENQLHTCLTQG